MRNWARKSLLAAAIVVAALAGLSVLGVAMFKGRPTWYGSGAAATEAQRAQLARDAENKLIEAQNWVATLRADEERAERYRQRSATAPAPRAAGTYLVELSQQELNALFDKWSTLYGWRGKYQQFLSDPEIVLREGTLIVAGDLKELGAITSFQFRPRLDEAGHLRLDLAKVTAGRLPLPESIWAKWRDGLVGSLQHRLPLWRARARIDASGAANFPAMAATLSEVFFAIAQRQPAEPILFFPLADGGASVPVKVVRVEVADEKLKLLVEPLKPAERTALLDRIRSTAPRPTARQAQAAGS